MHVLWRRPDGFHGATPSDFKVLELGGHSRIWVHKTDHEWFPFRVSGGWQDDEATKKLNILVSLINRPTSDWIAHLIKMHHNSMADDSAKFMSEMEVWLIELKGNAKGDKWEVEIIGHAVDEIRKGLADARPAFEKAAASP